MLHLFMLITREQVEYVALLARLKLSEDEKEQYTGQLNSILEYAKILEELDTSQVEPMAHVLPVQNVFRNDKAKDTLKLEEVLHNAPDRTERYFKVPRIL